MGALLSLSKSASTAGLHVSEITLLLFGVLLVVGLIGEYAKSDRWKKHLKTFEMLVIIGVAGELFADGGVFLFSEHLQIIADQEITEATKEAGDAAQSAKTARDEADAATLASVEAQRTADTANVVSGKAQRKADATSTLADEAVKNVVLTQSLISGRKIASFTNLVDRWQQLKGVSVLVESPASDPEASSLCSGLSAAAHTAGMNDLQDCGGVVMPGQIVNIFVSGPDDKMTSEVAEDLRNIAKLDTFLYGPLGKTAMLTILIGQKPPFVLYPPATNPKNKIAP